MHALYDFISGPMVWIAFGVFLGGCLFQLGRMLLLVYRKERFIFSFMSFKYSLRSILHWITPFGTVNMRLHPVMTLVTFAFHICLLLAPLFLMAHIVLWDEAWGFDWWAWVDWRACGVDWRARVDWRAWGGDRWRAELSDHVCHVLPVHPRVGIHRHLQIFDQTADLCRDP